VDAKRKPGERTIGIYDRPATPARPQWLRTAIVIVAIAVAVALMVMYVSR
jgi:hypothetical protein